MTEQLNVSKLSISNDCKSPNKCNVNIKRTEYLDWDEYFMSVAFLTAKRSKDPATQVGACIVNEDKRIVGIGYNGFPNGCSDDEFPWGKDPANKLHSKYLYVCHAEVNAVLNAHSRDLKNCTIYVALFPCNECAKVIIQSGIKTIKYVSDKHSDKIETIASKRMLDAAKVQCIQYIPISQKIEIDFNGINWDAMRQVQSIPNENNSETK